MTSSLVANGLHAESTGNPQQAIRDFRAAVATDHRDAVAYFDLGFLYQHVVNEPALAATAYKQALSIKPNYKSAMFNLAVVDTPSQPESAMNLYNELVLKNPKYALAYFNLGLLLIAQNQPIPGHEALKKAIALDPVLAQRLPNGITP